jgi:translation elongation factor EF-1alpha
MCLGVIGRGNYDEKPWNETNGTMEVKTEEFEWKPLSDWNGENVVSTQCSNTGAVIDWAIVPFIVEDLDSEEMASVDVDPSDGEL